MPKASFDADPSGRVDATADSRPPAIPSVQDVDTGRVTASFTAHGPGDS